MSDAPPQQRLSASLRGLMASAIGLVQVRLELITVEAREEILRVGELLVCGALAIAFLSLGLGFLAVLLTVLLWDSQRVLALAVFATLFLTVGLVAAFMARARVRQGSRLFAASREELQRDVDVLRP